MLLRPYFSSDFETLYQIDHACFPEGIAYSQRELAGFIAKRSAVTWVAEEDDTIVGFVIADSNAKGVGHIITIDVRNGWRRQGVGRMLMDAAEDWARRRGLTVIYLETADDNAGAQAFYQKRGYRKIDKLEHYYTNNQAAWVMMKRLRPATRVVRRVVEKKEQE